MPNPKKLDKGQKKEFDKREKEALQKETQNWRGTFFARALAAGHERSPHYKRRSRRILKRELKRKEKRGKQQD